MSSSATSKCRLRRYSRPVSRILSSSDDAGSAAGTSAGCVDSDCCPVATGESRFSAAGLVGADAGATGTSSSSTRSRSRFVRDRSQSSSVVEGCSTAAESGASVIEASAISPVTASAGMTGSAAGAGFGSSKVSCGVSTVFGFFVITWYSSSLSSAGTTTSCTGSSSAVALPAAIRASPSVQIFVLEGG